MILTQEIRVLGSSMGGAWKAAIAEVEPDCEVDRPWDFAAIRNPSTEWRLPPKQQSFNSCAIGDWERERLADSRKVLLDRSSE